MHAHLLALPGLLALLAEPVRWLVHTWTEPAYDSTGWLFAVLAGGLAAKSVASGPARPDAAGLRLAVGLLVLTAAVRLAGRVLDVDHLGALALVVDAIAAGRLLALERRPWPVAPWALGGLVALSLPVEHTLQQLVSFPLRVASAATVATVLAPLGVARHGTLLSGPSGPLSVELACSGATGLVALGVLAFTVAARRETGVRGLAAGTLAVVGGAWFANSLRLLSLVLRPTDAWLEEPWHTVVGLVSLAAGAVPALLVARALPPRTPMVFGEPGAFRLPAPVGLAFTGVALLVARAPARPLDVSAPVDAIRLPGVLGDRASTEDPLTEQERVYAGRFGGRIERRTYDGGHTVLLLRTTAPLRHLHSPDACLRGAGHDVERLGVRPGPADTVVWRTVDEDGAVWRVEASFLSESGVTATSASEVAWRWLAHPGAAWTLVERITPWDTCEADPAACASFDHALFRALFGDSQELACSG